MDMSAFASASEAQKKKTKIPVDEPSAPPESSAPPAAPEAPEAPAPPDDYQLAINQLIDLQQSGFTNPTLAQQTYQQFQDLLQNDPNQGEAHLATGYLLLVYGNAYHAQEPLRQASGAPGEAKSLIERAEAIVAKEKAALEKPKSKVKSRIKRARRITAPEPTSTSESTPSDDAPPTYQPKPLQFEGPILEDISTLRLSILVHSNSATDDPEVDQYDQLYDEIEDMLAQQTQSAMSQSQLIKVSLESEEVDALKNFYIQLKGRVNYIDKQMDILKEEFDEEDIRELEIAYNPLKSILNQAQRSIDTSQDLLNTKAEINQLVQSIQEQSEQANSIDKSSLNNNFNQFFDTYEAIADKFDQWEAQGIDLELMMYHLNKLGKALNKLQEIVES